MSLKPSRRSAIQLGAILAVTLGGLAALLAAAQARPETSAAPLAQPSGLKYLGVSSCTSVACHHQPVAQGDQGCEYTTWIRHDRHARAYLVLLDERSKLIEKNLRRLKTIEEARPEENLFCLKCHSLPVPPEHPRRQVLLADGVSCESCHGPAEKWLTQHYRSDWQRKSADAKRALGMLPTKDLVVRAELCVSCHVGTPETDPIHDLLGAGHPRINHFELANHLAQMPPHWNERAERLRSPGFEVQAWAVGQVVSARAALELLASRAANKDRPWPEFAEYDCAACHHDLREPSARPRPDQGHPQLSSLNWTSWYEATLPEALDGKPPAELATIRKLMAERYPDRDQVARLAKAAADQLNQALPSVARSSYNNPNLLAQRLGRLAADQPPQGWDTAAQRYLALTAVYRTMGDLDPRRRNPRILTSLRAMHGLLDRPHGSADVQPPRFSAERFFEEQRKIQDQLGK
jgi:hypothetical protein